VVAAPSQHLPGDPPADPGGGLVSQPHQVEVINDDDRVRQRPPDRRQVDRARVHRHEPHLVVPRLAVVIEPAGDGLTGPPGDLTEQPAGAGDVGEEIFGPVLVIHGYGSESEALELANDTQYGLNAAVWSADEDRALRFSRGIKAGQVVVNGGLFNPRAPFGGFKLSGVGRELGMYGVDEFLETRAFQL
jgi:acyl-CoA reductase-like NAD-dependent aldehyde dehydrogenase